MADTDTKTPAAAFPAPRIDEFIERWWNDTFPGSVLGRDTELWNHVYAAKEDLKARLKKLV